MTHLALWLFVGLMLVGSHVWHAGCALVDRNSQPSKEKAVSKVQNVRRRQAIRVIRRLGEMTQRSGHYGCLRYPLSAVGRVMVGTSGKLWKARTLKNRLEANRRRKAGPTPEMIESWELLELDA